MMTKVTVMLLVAVALSGLVPTSASKLKKVSNAIPNSYIVVLDDKLLTKPVSEAAEELASRLAEYRRAKEAAQWLRARLEERRDLHFRLGPAPLAPEPERGLAPQQPEKLAAALRALAVEPPTPSTAHMALRFPPVSQFLDRWRALLRRRKRLDFEQEVAGLSRVEVAVAFLALLELRKGGEIAIDQAAPFAPIRISRADVERKKSWIAHSA